MDSEPIQFLREVWPVSDFKRTPLRMCQVQREFLPWVRYDFSYALESPDAMPGGGLVRREVDDPYDPDGPFAVAEQITVYRSGQEF